MMDFVFPDMALPVFAVAPVVAGAAIAGGASLLGSLFGSSKSASAVDKTNKANKEIAEMNNAFNERMLDKQNTWNLEQWNRENEYNSAAAQKARFLQAGLNPYLAMMGGASAGSASNVTSAAAAPADQTGRQMPADYSGYQRAFETLGNTASNIIQARSVDQQTKKSNAEIENLNAETSGTVINNEYKSVMLRAELAERLAHSDLSKSQKEYFNKLADQVGQQTTFFDSNWNNYKTELESRAYMQAMTGNRAYFEAETSKKKLPFIAPQLRAEIASLGAQTAMMYATADVSKQQAISLITQNLKDSFGGFIHSISPEKWNEMAEGFYTNAQSAIRANKANAGITETEQTFKPWKETIGIIGGAASAAGNAAKFLPK